ncbi:MAG: thioredoxin-disulfide reductase [Candidatus Brocadiia bacterium]
MSDEYEVVVIGAGVAGLAAALYTGRALMKTVVLEKTVIGGQIIESYDVDNYPGFPEGITGADLVEQMVEHVEKFDVTIDQSGARDVQLVDGNLKRVITDDGELLAPIVIVASGATHRKLDVPGEQRLSGHGVSYCATCDGPFFRDKKLVVVGGGDSATTEGVFLTRFASEVKLIHRRQGFRATPAHVQEAEENDKIEFILDTVVTEIDGDDKVEGVTTENVKTGETRRIDCDGVFIFIGHEPNTGFLKSVLPDFAGDVIPVDYNMETDIPGLYAAGDVRKGSYRQVGTAIGEGITAAMHAEDRIKQLRAQPASVQKK